MRKTAFIFALAMSVAACVPKSKYDALESQYQECQQDLRKKEAMVRKFREEYNALVTDLKPLVDRNIVTIALVDGKVTIGMRAEILFPSGSADLSDSGRANVQELARILARRTESDWQIEGHTDPEPISTAQFPDNWYLGAARAITVTKEFIKSGMEAKHVSAATYAQYQPQASNASESGKAQNRRIEVVLVPDLSGIPGFEKMNEGGQRRRGPGAPRPQ